MQYPLDLTCYLREWEAIFDDDLVGALLVDLSDQGYYLAAEAELAETFPVWWSMLRGASDDLPPGQERGKRPVIEPGMSAMLREEYAAFRARECDCLEFRAYHTQHVLEFRVLIQGGDLEPVASAEVDQDYLTDAYGESRLQAYERWIAVIKLIYRHLHPCYASTYDADFWRPEDQTGREDIRAAHIRCLTLINIFGPELVRHYGREYLLATPLWRVEPLDDGGMLLLPEPYRSGYVPAWRQASSHLGIALPRAAS